MSTAGPMNINEAIDGTIKLLREKGWIRHKAAVDDEGNRVDFKSSAACAFCIFGAFGRVTGEEELDLPLTREFTNRLVAALPRRGVGNGPDRILDFNDKEAENVDEVIAVLEKARVTDG